MSDFDWNGIIETGDAERIWNAIYSLVQNQGTGQICSSSQAEHQSLDEIHSDIAQEVFLRLITLDRLTHFAANGFTSPQIESDLILNELATVLAMRKEYLAAEAPKDEQQQARLCRQPVTFKISQAIKPI
jgi:hypothetical protein